MQFICVVTASYTLGFLMTKNPSLVFPLKRKISQQNFVLFSIMEKMLVMQILSMEKMLIIQFTIIEKVLILLFS